MPEQGDTFTLADRIAKPREGIAVFTIHEHFRRDLYETSQQASHEATQLA